jgi:hypothetical protein
MIILIVAYMKWNQDCIILLWFESITMEFLFMIKKCMALLKRVLSLLGRL